MPRRRVRYKRALQPARRRYVAKRKYRKKKPRIFRREPFPRIMRVRIPIVDYTRVGAASGANVPQELVYNATSVYDCDTQGGQQPAAYFNTLMKYYRNFTIRYSKCYVKWSIDAFSQTQDYNFIVVNDVSGVIANSTNYLSLQSNTTFTRSPIKHRNEAVTLESKNRCVFKMKRERVGSSWFDNNGNNTGNPEGSMFFHIIKYPININKTLDACNCWVKIIYYVEFYTPETSVDVYA